MNIYLIGAYMHGGKVLTAVKIGKARDIRQRLAELQTGNHCPLRVVASWKCHSDTHATGVEKFAHCRLRKYRIRGEWFQPALSEIVDAINSRLASGGLDSPADSAAARHNDRELLAEIAKFS